jgi:hypothetical protein
MNSEEITLISDAIKLGFPILGTLLGGIIGGLTAFFLARLNHKNEKLKDLNNKRINLLIQAATDITEFEDLIGAFATCVANEVVGNSDKARLEETRLAVKQGNLPLRRARMTLKVLGLKEANDKLEVYIEFAREVMSNSVNLEKSRALELNKFITRGPVDFYQCLSNEFPK